MREFKLPDVGEGISEGEVVEWRVSVGDDIAEGDVVAEIATDKVTVELPAPTGGVVRELRVEAGDVVPVGSVLMVIDDGTSHPATTDENGGTGDSVPAAADVGAAASGASTHAPTSGGDDTPPGDPLATALGRVIAAPSTRRYAAETGVDLTTLSGSGPGGRILREDVDAARTAVTSDPTPGPAAAPEPRREAIRGMRAASFQHMARSSRTAAAATTTFEVAADGLMAALPSLRAEAAHRDARITPVVLVAKCVATSLQRHERLNATIDEDARELLLHPRVDLGIAVATQEGLVVPVLRDVGNRSVVDLAVELSQLSERARAGRLELEEVRGGTFTLSSTGGLETAAIASTTPVINLPQVATMWVSRITDRPRVGPDGQLEVGPLMVCSISFDHRVVDGAEATAFINDVAEVLIDPVRGLA